MFECFLAEDKTFSRLPAPDPGLLVSFFIGLSSYGSGEDVYYNESECRNSTSIGRM